MPSVKFVRQTFPSRMVAEMTVAVMSPQKNTLKLQIENKINPSHLFSDSLRAGICQ